MKVKSTPWTRDLARITRIRAATDVENGCKAVAIVARHPDDHFYDRCGGTVELDSARQSLSALAFVIITEVRHRTITLNRGAKVSLPRKFEVITVAKAQQYEIRAVP